MYEVMALPTASVSLAPERQSARAKDTTPRSSPARPKNHASPPLRSIFVSTFVSRFACPMTFPRSRGY